MKYTINNTQKVQGKNLKLGRYINLADIGEEWAIINRIPKDYFYHVNKTVFVRTKDPDGTCHLQRRATRENVHKIENRERRRYRLAKDDTTEFVLEIAEAINGVTWEAGAQYIRIYAQRPRKTRRTKTQNAPKPTAAPAPVTLTSNQWAEFLK